MADASELSSTCPLAASAGKTPGKAQQASPRLPSVVDHGTRRQLSYWNTPTIIEGEKVYDYQLTL